MIPHNRPCLGLEEEQAALDVLRSGWLAQGQEVAAFEREICAYFGLPPEHAVAVSSGTAALFIALMILNPKKASVAMPAYACSALRNAVALTGTDHILIDNEENSPNIDMACLNALQPSVAIIPHMYGVPQKIEINRNYLVIEDIAQALGARIEGQLVGLQGDVGIMSFYATKMITSGGYGGMLISLDESLISEARDFREFDCRHDRKIRFNFQMPEVCASIGRAQLQKLEYFIQRRKQIYDQYNSIYPLLGGVTTTHCEPVRYRAIIRHPQAAFFQSVFIENGIQTINPLNSWELLGNPDEFPNAAELCLTTLSLPIYPALTDCQVADICNAIEHITKQN